jgi:hypothetical protein
VAWATKPLTSASEMASACSYRFLAERCRPHEPSGVPVVRRQRDACAGEGGGLIPLSDREFGRYDRLALLSTLAMAEIRSDAGLLPVAWRHRLSILTAHQTG